MSEPNVTNPAAPATEPAKTGNDKIDVTIEYLDNLAKDYPQVLEKWLNEGATAKKVLAPWKDSHVSQGLNTFKEKTLPQIESELRNKLMTELNPPKNPWEHKVAEIDAKLKEAEKAAKVAEIKARGASYISQSSFDLGNVLEPNDFIRGTEEETVSYIDKMKAFAKYYEEKGRKSFIKDNNYNPPAGENEAVPFGGDEKKWQEAIKAGRSPAFGPEFEKIRVAIYKFKNGKK